MSIAVDTNRLVKPAQRKLVSTWLESSQQQVVILPRVAHELTHGKYTGELEFELQQARETADRVHKRGDIDIGFIVDCDIWWLEQFQDTQSMYTIRELSHEERDQSIALLHALPLSAFPKRHRDDMRLDGDANIVSQALVTGQRLLVTSDRNTIKSRIVNDWILENGQQHGVQAQETVFEHDTVFRDIYEQHPQRLLAIALASAWPEEINASSNEVISQFEGLLGAMRGAILPKTAELLRSAWDMRKNNDILEFVKSHCLPHKTRKAERLHPTFPARRNSVALAREPGE